MGLLDALFPNSDGGGLLDFLKQNAMGQQFAAAGAPGDQAQYGGAPQAGAYQPGQVQAAPLPPIQQPAAGGGVPQAPPQGAAPMPPQSAAAPQPAAPDQPNFFNRAADALASISRGGSMLGAVRGQFDDPQSQQAQISNKTARALIGKGVDPQVAIAAVQPGNTEMLKQLIDQNFGKPQAPTSLGEGHIWNPQTGKVETAYEPTQKDNFVVVQKGENEFGKKVFVKMNRATGEEMPWKEGEGDLPPGSGPVSGTGLLNSGWTSPNDLSNPGTPQLVPGTGNPATASVAPTPSLDTKRYSFRQMPDGTIVKQDKATGDVTPVVKGGSSGAGGSAYLAKGVQNYDPDLPPEEYIKQFSPEARVAIEAYKNGESMPNDGTSKKGWAQQIRAFAQLYGNKTGEEVSDASFSAKRKMRTDLASSTPNSAGGIISNGKSAFAHLGELSDKAVDLGNYAGPDIPGGGHIASASNYVTNRLLPTSQTKGKLTGFNDNALKYGQEATKFYAGTGGGVAERMHALTELDPTSSTADQQAAFLETEKSLMMDRLRAKEAQVREQLGQPYLDKHPVVTPDVIDNVKKIDGNIAKLRGQAPDDAPAQNTTKNGVKWSVE